MKNFSGDATEGFSRYGRAWDGGVRRLVVHTEKTDSYIKGSIQTVNPGAHTDIQRFFIYR